MDYLGVDYETYYSPDYSLTKMTTAEYIRSPEFELQMVSVRRNNEKPKVYFADETDIAELLRDEYRLHENAMVAHNAMFDGAITEWRLGIKPRFYFCTASMARAVVSPFTDSASLYAVSKYFGLAEKMVASLAYVKAVHLADWAPDIRKDMEQYSWVDVDNCMEILRRTVRLFTQQELVLIHLNILKFTRPQLRLNATRLRGALASLRARRAVMLSNLRLEGRERLMSNQKFASLLREKGVEPPTKISVTTGQTTFAFARTDHGMQALMEHPNVEVQMLVAARKEHKSTLAETKKERYLKQAEINPNAAFPVPLLYCGAHTGRYSGGDKLNAQNMERGSPEREAIFAADPYVVVAGDASQIEARFAHTFGHRLLNHPNVGWLHGMCKINVDTLRCDTYDWFFKGLDPYVEMAKVIYDNPHLTKADKDERFIGKRTVLGLGYGMWATRFIESLAWDGVKVTYDFGKDVVLTYRRINSAVEACWTLLSAWLVNEKKYRNMVSDVFGVEVILQHETMYGDVIGFILPNGLPLIYPKHQAMWNEDRVVGNYSRGGHRKKLHGAIVFENLIQALSQCKIKSVEYSLFKRHKLRAAMQVHDELVYVILKKYVNAFTALFTKEMRREFAGLPELPLDCEVKSGPNYLECK